MVICLTLFSRSLEMSKYNTAQMLVFSIGAASAFWEKAFKRFGHKIEKMPEIKMNSRLTATAGRAWLKSDFIDLSCYLMEKYPDYFENDTIPHELCHFIAYRVFGDKGHGPQWKFVMMELGLIPNRLHSMQTKHQAEKLLK